MGNRNVSNKPLPPFFPVEGKEQKASRERITLCSSASPNYFWIQTLYKVPYITLNLGIFALSPGDKAREAYSMCRVIVLN